jgi:dTDP-4-dehydrorhamnose reductase
MIVGITGYKGRLGSQLLTYSDCVPLECDITDVESIKEAISKVDPDVIINCAAYTNVDGAEVEYDKAREINTHGVRNLRAFFEGKLIHISTDYVFDGVTGPYDERKRMYNPFNNYGWSKVGGEVVLLNAFFDKESIVVRTTGLYGGVSGRPDFASFVLDKLKRGEIFLASDELIGNQTYIPHLAHQLHILVNLSPRYNTINLASQDTMSRCRFACKLADAFGYDRGLVEPVENADIPDWTAKRPSYGGLVLGQAFDSYFPVYTVDQGIKAYKEAIG